VDVTEYEVLAAEPRVGADNDLYAGSLAQCALYEASEFHDASRAVLTGRTKPATKQVFAEKIRKTACGNPRADRVQYS